MSSVLFYDPVCRAPYDTRTVSTQALGGSEATLARVADALGAWVIQHNRTDDWERYRPPQALPGITTVIVNREPRALADLGSLYPQAQLYLWLHDRMRPGGRRARALGAQAAALGRLQVRVVCVSDWQRADVEATLARLGLSARVSANTAPVRLFSTRTTPAKPSM